MRTYSPPIKTHINFYDIYTNYNTGDLIVGTFFGLIFYVSAHLLYKRSLFRT